MKLRITEDALKNGTDVVSSFSKAVIYLGVVIDLIIVMTLGFAHLEGSSITIFVFYAMILASLYGVICITIMFSIERVARQELRKELDERDNNDHL